MEKIKLNNGLEIPAIGFGTWKAPTGEITIEAVKNAISSGFRFIDCASVYGNEKEVGFGIQAGGVAREELFITGKLWNDIRGYQETIEAFEKTCSDLQVDYLDMYMLHWPRPSVYHDDYIEKNAQSWKAMQDLVKAGRVKSIAVSNFKVHHLEELMERADIKPAANQIEFHPSCFQTEVRAFCEKNEIAVQGYSTLANGKVFECEEIIQISKEQNVSVAQLCTKYAMQHHVIPLVKSVNKERILSNLQLDFTLDKKAMDQIDKVTTCGGSYNDSDLIEF
ncbi:MAG: aldo/keto reductase [Lachnospiraceae bacterium]|nr:aldo/keto reductase [Lachnospiraceae bacterium]